MIQTLNIFTFYLTVKTDFEIFFYFFFTIVHYYSFVCSCISAVSAMYIHFLSKLFYGPSKQRTSILFSFMLLFKITYNTNTEYHYFLFDCKNWFYFFFTIMHYYYFVCSCISVVSVMCTFFLNKLFYGSSK